MAFVHSKSSRALLGALALSGYLKSWEHATEREMADVTVLIDSGHRFLPGLDNGSASLEGVFDNTVTAGSQDQTLDAALGAATASVVTLAPEGFALGKRVISLEARESTYAISAPVADAVTFGGSWQSDGQVDVGVALHDLTAETATGNSSSVDNTASSSGGASAALHVTANTRDGSTTIKVQHSVDNSAWVDLITFTAVGAATTTSQRSTVTGTVNRYLRETHTLAGAAGSITYAVAASRR